MRKSQNLKNKEVARLVGLSVCIADQSKCFYICQAIDELRFALFKLLCANFLMQLPLCNLLHVILFSIDWIINIRQKW